MNQRNEGDRYIAKGNGRELHREKQQGLIFWKNVGQIRVTGEKTKLLLHAGTFTTATFEMMKDLNESNKKLSVGKTGKWVWELPTLKIYAMFSKH